MAAGRAALDRPSDPPGLSARGSGGGAGPRVEAPDAEGRGPVVASTPRASIRGLLSERARAVRERDATAFMASVDPEAPANFRRSQRELFVNLGEVPLSTWGYRVEQATPVATPPPRGLPVPPDEVRAPKVLLRYALAGVDTVPTTQPLGYVFVRRGDRWYVASGESLPGDRSSWRGPWNFGDCRVTVTDSGLVIGHDGNRELTRRIARMLDPAVAGVTRVWGEGWSQKVGVVVPGSQEELEALVGPEFAVAGIAAVAVADEVNVAHGRVEGPRVVFNTDTADGLDDTALRVVLRHEITHIAARADTVDGAPMWLLEGFADYVGYRDSGLPADRIAPDLARQVRRHGPPEALPSNAEFRLAGSRLDLAYQQSWSVIAFLASRIGARAVVELYHRLAGQRADPSTVDEALREVAGMSTAELLDRWGAHLRRVHG